MIAFSEPYRHRSGTGLSAAMIDALIAEFYARVRRDDLLGPVFADIIGDDWDAHLEKIAAFWRYATRIDRTYNARDFVSAHVKHPQIQVSLLPRWLLLFRQTAREVCPQEAADLLIDIAERMAASIEMSLANRKPPA
jgi:hemoglobin